MTGTSTSVPTVSIVLPVYNGAKTIAETLDSVFAQTLRDFELIIIDDGSTDGTRDVVGRCSDPRVQFHAFENGGPSACRNRGLRLARGRFVAFIDADDLWTPDKLAKQVAALESDRSAALVYSLTDQIDERGKRLGPASHCRESGDVYERLLLSNFLDNGSTPLVRRDILQSVGDFDESLRAGEDWDLWLRIARHHRFACVPEPQVLYRVYAGSSCSKVQMVEEHCLRVLKAGFARLPASDRREALERKARTLLYRSLTSRILVTARSRRDVLFAYRYWRKFAASCSGWRDRVWSGVYLARAITMTLLPLPVARPLLAVAKSILTGLRRRA